MLAGVRELRVKQDVTSMRLAQSTDLMLAMIASSFIATSCSNTHDYDPADDLSKVKISLQRSACYGSCPDYKVTIFGDGRVLFTTDTSPANAEASVHRAYARSVGVLLPGTHEDKIAPDAVAALFEKFRAANFFHFKRI